MAAAGCKQRLTVADTMLSASPRRFLVSTRCLAAAFQVGGFWQQPFAGSQDFPRFPRTGKCVQPCNAAHVLHDEPGTASPQPALVHKPRRDPGGLWGRKLCSRSLKHNPDLRWVRLGELHGCRDPVPFQRHPGVALAAQPIRERAPSSAWMVARADDPLRRPQHCRRIADGNG
jgi:hypothetical protein